MAGDVLRLLLRKKTGQAPTTARTVRPVKRISRGIMIERRDRCMTEIARLRSDETTSGSLANKARQLLTAHWATSSWRARADILRTAEWLLGISRKVAGSSMPSLGDTEPNGEARDRSHDKQPHL
jgi:hypothetical protein